LGLGRIGGLKGSLGLKGFLRNSGGKSQFGFWRIYWGRAGIKVGREKEGLSFTHFCFQYWEKLQNPLTFRV